MNSMKSLMLAAAMATGVLGLGASTAQAAEFRVYARGPVAYVPPCPGEGYVWAAGYMNDGYWIPGRWNFVGVRGGNGYRGYTHFDRDDHRNWDRDRDRNRHFERDHDRGRNHDRFRR